ncbi:MAG TPA: carboxynorspermidine decarboxylase [Porphyromonadaceae bacterium]|nr:carboxynorspermidine decarboxylase [Porphyromonadaceae bacterium]
MTHQTPYYIVYEEHLRRNLEIITGVMQRTGVNIIMAFKANALWKSFPIIAEYVKDSTASSINEMRLSHDYLGGDVHAYCPVYTDETFPQFLTGCTHITFNSLAQYSRHADALREHNSKGRHVSAGLRVNPRCSVIETDIYNPCMPGSRFGENPDTIGDNLPEGIEGLHFHALCESTSYDLEKVLDAFKRQYGHLLPQVKWVNMGGGHLMTRRGYDIDHLVKTLNAFKESYPHLDIIMEPGSAFTWQTGDLIVTVLDVIERDGIRTAIIDASFACHMPDCLEMPYRPNILEALPDDATDGITYRLGGNSCLSGDFVGDWKFAKPLKAGDRLTLLDMNHYTNVKTTMFNGIQHPDVLLQSLTGETRLLRHYTYEDYRDRMD